MGVILFSHNQAAYEAAILQMKALGKAAVIHPTGTGKSFIAFKLCEDHPNKKVCWLSPSEYIFHTQEENWTRAGGEPLMNIRFFTYAKLMLMNEEDMEEIRPDFIVLDEFHRCGAQMWGQGVQRLLSLFPEAPLLGLSATNIRYLDNQRDMADELFDGSIASEMTLGEAVVRGILHPPKYVLSVFSYQKDLKRYEEQIHSARNPAVRDTAQKALEALRRALEKADGLDEVFFKHMRNTAGKYIVFCANNSHMQDMIEKVPEWFKKVDKEPHVYAVYSEDPFTSREFAAFKADGSIHLKLLFCIDMLNEGIHVEDVSGVILLRPTVSPIIYKQQIGRALSAGKKQEAVVFDIVLNIENLCSIGALEKEMQAALEEFRAQGKEADIVNRHFQVIDEAADCVRLFQELEGTLHASWEMMYACAKRYWERYGNLEIPKRYRTQEGYSLGQWLDTQRRVYAGKAAGRLTPGQVRRLEEIGMRWEGGWETSWERNLAAARKYYEAHGHLLAGAREEAYGVALGRWLSQLRTARKNKEGHRSLTPERMKQLEEIGMIWDVPSYQWEKNYASAERYFRKHGNLDVPGDYTDEEGIHLGRWLSRIKTARRSSCYQGAELTSEQEKRLTEIGMDWGRKWDAAWEKSYEAARTYYEATGSLDIPVGYQTQDGCRLGKWVRRQRDAYRCGNLDGERRKKLNTIGMEWETKRSKVSKKPGV